MSTVSYQFLELVHGNDVDGVIAALTFDPGLALAVESEYTGITGLHVAAHRGLTKIVDLLLAHGADVHARELGSGATPLHWAAEAGHPALIQRFVDLGADLEVRDQWFNLTPLGYATVVRWNPKLHRDRAGAAALLAQLGSAPDVFTAVATSNEAQIRDLVAADPAALSRRLGSAAAGMQPLHLAISRRLTAVTHLLVDLGADTNARTNSGVTALGLALSVRDTETAAYLQAHGAMPDLSSALLSGDMTATEAELRRAPDPALASQLLFIAARTGHAAAIELLIRQGHADPDVRAPHIIREQTCLATPLHLAAMHGRDAAAQALLTNGASPNPGPAEHVATPLHLAAGEGHAATVRVLLEHGADQSIEDPWFNSTPAGWAEFCGHDELIDLLTIDE